jgi:class 3 adenylate cyclase
VHREAHGMVAEKIIEIQPELAEGFLDGVETNDAGAAVIPGGAADDRDPGIRTVLFTDIVDSTALTQSMGDEAAMALFDVHNFVVRNALGNLGGREVKHTGDGIMASFVSAAAAVKCATQIQRDLARHEKNQRDLAVKVRIGAAAGEPVEQHNDLFGCTVQLAARLCSHASPEQILVSNAIAELCLGKGFSFQDVGEVALKGFDRPVRAHAVVWTDQATLAAV